MKLNLIKIAFRNLLKDRVYTFINLMGLTLGISFSFLIYIYVKHQLSYDMHISQGENIYRILADFDINGQRQVYYHKHASQNYALSVQDFSCYTILLRLSLLLW